MKFSTTYDAAGNSTTKATREPGDEFLCDICNRIIAGGDGVSIRKSFRFNNHLLCKQCFKYDRSRVADAIYPVGHDLWEESMNWGGITLAFVVN